MIGIIQVSPSVQSVLCGGYINVGSIDGDVSAVDTGLSVLHIDVGIADLHPHLPVDAGERILFRGVCCLHLHIGAVDDLQLIHRIDGIVSIALGFALLRHTDLYPAVVDGHIDYPIPAVAGIQAVIRPDQSTVLDGQAGECIDTVCFPELAVADAGGDIQLLQAVEIDLAQHAHNTVVIRLNGKGTGAASVDIQVFVHVARPDAVFLR